jgi:uncharacterized OB-fold protein
MKNPEAIKYKIDTENMYIYDPVPQQTEDQNMVYKFYDHLKEGRLTSTQCNDCNHISWPPRIVCPECISDDLNWVDLPKNGKVYTYTVQVNAVPPGFKAPLVFAVIDLENGMRVVSPILDIKPEDVKMGTEVELKVVPASHNRVLFFFAPKIK